MKKVLAIALALVMALSCSAIAFAEETTVADETTTAAAAGDTNIDIDIDVSVPEAEVITLPAENAKCGLCGSVLAEGEALADHVCPTEAATEKDYIDLTVKEVLAMIVELAKAGMTQWADVETVVIKIVDFLDGLVNGTLTGSVDGLVAELEGLFDGIKIPGIDALIKALKEKILSFYAPGTVVPTTEPEDISDTGSAPVGIAVFAAVSVAAAAAFVCTKKKD